MPNIRVQDVKGNIALGCIAYCTLVTHAMRPFRPWGTNSRGAKIPGEKNWTARFREKTSCHRCSPGSGHIGQGCHVQGTHYPRAASSKGRIVRRTERNVRDFSFGLTLVGEHIILQRCTRILPVLVGDGCDWSHLQQKRQNLVLFIYFLSTVYCNTTVQYSTKGVKKLSLV